MKKTILIAGILLITLLTACTNNGSVKTKTPQPKSVNDIIEEKMAEEDNTSTDSEDKTNESSKVDISTDIRYENVDIDLTAMSSTMVYSEVYNMVTTPQDYLGKIIKMKGTTDHYIDEQTNRHYYSCIIQDATACCAQGIEFILADKKTPDDYPETGDKVTLVGKFGVYKEDGYFYCTLSDAQLTE